MLALVLLSLGVSLLFTLSVRRVRHSRFLEVDPSYQAILDDLKLSEVEHFLALPAVIVSGHPSRNVSQVTLGTGPDAVRAYLKREHRVRWRDYFINVLSGFGWVSRSCREAVTLRLLCQAGVPCPEVIASGEDGQGKAFVLVREIEGACELRAFLREQLNSPSLLRGDGRGGGERCSLARKLGEALARMHAAGFYHGDLHSTHVLVRPTDGTIHFLDWQRSRRRRRLSWRDRSNDLAALHATLADDLATPRERLVCLAAYLSNVEKPSKESLSHSRVLARRVAGAERSEAPACQPGHRCALPRPPYCHVLARIRRQSERLLRKRYIRELREASLAVGVQNLIWLDGEALCVTREFQAEMGGRIPEWLRLSQGPAEKGHSSITEIVRVSETKEAILVRRGTDEPLRWLWSRLHGRPFTSPEFRQAALLFRLQRYGIAAPQILAVGQRQTRPWRMESFLLTEAAESLGLSEWLAQKSGRKLFTAERKQYRRILWEAGAMLRRLHDAGCYLDGRLSAIGVCQSRDRQGATLGSSLPDGRGSAIVALRSVAEVRMRRGHRPKLARRDLKAMLQAISAFPRGKKDALRFLLGYQGRKFSRAATAERSAVAARLNEFVFQRAQR